VLVGSKVGLLVQASGSGSLGYQWRKNGVPLAGATSEQLVLGPASPTHDGSYDVVVTDGCGSTTSSAAKVRAVPVLLSLSQPAGAGSLRILDRSLLPGAHWFHAFSFDAANATAPGAGWFGGLHVDFGLVLAEFAVGAPPFVGTFDGLGRSLFQLPGGSISAGQTAWGVTIVYDPLVPAVMGWSNVAGLTIQ
jgi:hypothetical protein